MEGDKVCFMYYEELRLKQFSYAAFCLGGQRRRASSSFMWKKGGPHLLSYSLVPLKHTRVSPGHTSVVLSLAVDFSAFV